MTAAKARDEVGGELDQVAAELDGLEALDARVREEDKQHDRDLRQAQRDGTPKAVEDRRTPSDQRQAERAAIEERLWAGVTVLGEVADAVIAALREHEDDWLADLRVQLEPAREKRREAERLLGWRPGVSLKEGLAKTIPYFEELLSQADVAAAVRL